MLGGSDVSISSCCRFGNRDVRDRLRRLLLVFSGFTVADLVTVTDAITHADAVAHADAHAVTNADAGTNADSGHAVVVDHDSRRRPIAGE